METNEPRLPGREIDPVIAGAETSLGRTPEERWAMFRRLQRRIGASWAHFSEEEMRRRLDLAERLDPRPDPWWKNIEAGGLP